MENSNLIAIETFCTIHGVETAFIYAVQDIGLIEVISVDEIPYIREEHLLYLEKSVRLNRELDINFEGIGAIFQLLGEVDTLKQEINTLKNKLRLYESQQ